MIQVNAISVTCKIFQKWYQVNLTHKFQITSKFKIKKMQLTQICLSDHSLHRWWVQRPNPRSKPESTQYNRRLSPKDLLSALINWSPLSKAELQICFKNLERLICHRLQGDRSILEINPQITIFQESRVFQDLLKGTLQITAKRERQKDRLSNLIPCS